MNFLGVCDPISVSSPNPPIMRWVLGLALSQTALLWLFEGT